LQGRASLLEPITLYIGLDPHIRWEKSAYRPVPKFLRPSPLNLIYKPLTEQVPKEMSSGSIKFNALDFDAY
jgi:hypothetical protein